MTKNVEMLQARCANLALLNAFLCKMPPTPRKRAIMALWGEGIISATAVQLLIEEHHLESA